MSISFQKIDSAMSQLKDAVAITQPSSLERDGIIQRFEYSVELLWKIAKVVLSENGVTAMSPKDVVREMASIGWIDNPETFINYIKMRNETNHSYKEEVAQLVYSATLEFVNDADALITLLREKA